jgi:hypothetical protein
LSELFKKLNLKDQKEILVLNVPETFEAELARLEGVLVRRILADVPQIIFSVAFVTKQDEVDRLSRLIAEKAEGDALIWFAYPKGSSKKYRCEFNRDTGWAVLGELGFEPVRQVAIDADWSALRFRRVEYIHRMTRDSQRAMSAQGKKRVSSQGG